MYSGMIYLMVMNWYLKEENDFVFFRELKYEILPLNNTYYEET